MDSDNRFHTFNDPRFLKLPLKESKTKIDKRFTKFITDQNNNKLKKVDIFGRPFNNSKEKLNLDQELSNYYYLDDELNDIKTTQSVLSVNYSPQTENFENNLIKDHENDLIIEKKDSAFKVDEEKDSSIWNTYNNNIPKGSSTHRLAIMGCEWHNITAVDLLVLLQSFNPNSQYSENNTFSINNSLNGIEHVAIYPSDFGLKNTEKEKFHGPILEEDPNIDLPATQDTQNKIIKSDNSELNEFYKSTEQEELENQEIIRNYQYKRSLYYYAIVTCSSISIASKLYDELDGIETDFAINGFDLRFVPNDVNPPHPSISEASEIPPNYESPTIIGRSALRHSKVKCTWDEPEVERTRFFTKKFSAKELENMDVEAFLGSEDDFDSSENEINTNNNFQKVDEKNLLDYRKTLLGDIANEDDDSSLQININSNSDKEDLSNRMLLSNQKLTSSSKEIKNSNSNKRFDKIFSEDKKISADKNSTKIKKSQKININSENENLDEIDDLEIVTMDMKIDSKKNDKLYNNKHKKLQKMKQKNKQISEDSFKIDTEDPRFSRIFSHFDFAIDPTHPQFKNTDSNKSLLFLKRQKAKKPKTNINSDIFTSNIKLDNFNKSSSNLNTDSHIEPINDIVLLKKRKTC